MAWIVVSAEENVIEQGHNGHELREETKGTLGFFFCGINLACPHILWRRQDKEGD